MVIIRFKFFYRGTAAVQVVFGLFWREGGYNMMDIILVALLIIALGCIAALHRTDYIGDLNNEEDVYRIPFDGTNPDYMFNINNLYNDIEFDDDD